MLAFTLSFLILAASPHSHASPSGGMALCRQRADAGLPSGAPVLSGDSPGHPQSKAGRRNTLGWDLSYSSVLKRNGVGRGEWLHGWLGSNYQSPAEKILAGWRGGPIVSSFLLEYPAFHAGERTTWLLVRTANQAYQWQIVEGKDEVGGEPVDSQSYDNIYRTLSSWEQGKPLRPEMTPPGGIPGYAGFLSIYGGGKSRQMLLTLEDFFVYDRDHPDDFKPGRLTNALEPLAARAVKQ